MRARRIENGAMVVSSSKVSFEFDAQGRPVDCQTYQNGEASVIVEEVRMPFKLRCNAYPII